MAAAISRGSNSSKVINNETMWKKIYLILSFFYSIRILFLMF